MSGTLQKRATLARPCWPIGRVILVLVGQAFFSLNVWPISAERNISMGFTARNGHQKVALVSCPLASRNAIPLALPSLAAYAELHGYPVECLDLNMEFQDAIRAKGVAEDIWNAQHWYGSNPATIESTLEEMADDWAKIIMGGEPTIVGVTITVTSMEVSLMMAKAIKRQSPATKTVFGGPECKLSWRRFIAKKAVDFVVLGEGEQPFVKLLGALDQGLTQFDIPAVVTKAANAENHPSAVNTELDALPRPAFSKMALARYTQRGVTELPILASAGCVQSCTFCSRNFLDGAYRCKSPQRIIDELQHNIETYGVKDFVFVDSLINGKVAQLVGWTSGVIEQALDIRWQANAILSPRNSAQVLQTMRQSGCIRLWYGLESGSAPILKDMRKFADIQRIEQNLRDTHEAGILVTCYMLVGYPTETEADFQATLNFLARNRSSIDSVLPSICYVGEETILEKKKDSYEISGEKGNWQNPNSTPDLREWRYQKLVSVAEALGIEVHGRGLIDYLPLPKEKPV